MLKKLNRLAKTRDIQKTFARGRSFFNPLVSIKLLPTPKLSRFTVVISTKVFKNAVARNRLKRVAREYLRNNLNKLKPGDYIIAFKPRAGKVPEKEAMAQLIQMLAKVK